MTRQERAAMQAMSEWLSDEHELGHPPAEIECAGTFDLHEMHYYMFRYKKSRIDREWLLGVCGGYADDGLTHCGHVFSEMEPFDPATAEEKSVAMVEMIREYWMAQAKQELERREEPEKAAAEGEEHTGSFVGFVLLSSCEWEKETFCRDLLQEWGVAVEETEEESSIEGDSFVFEADGMLAAVSLMPAPIPNGEAEENAANNYLWPEAVETTKGHTAHLIIAVLGKDHSPYDAGELFVKLCSTCLNQKNALGVYTSGTVFEPAFYHDAARMMQDGSLPILNWIYFGLYQGKEGISGYTYGMTLLGKEEIEVLEANTSPSDLRNFLVDIAYYVLSSDVTLHDGETIGFSEDQKLPISRSEGVAVDGYSLKIGYPNDGVDSDSSSTRGETT